MLIHSAAPRSQTAPARIRTSTEDTSRLSSSHTSRLSTAHTSRLSSGHTSRWTTAGGNHMSTSSPNGSDHFINGRDNRRRGPDEMETAREKVARERIQHFASKAVPYRLVSLEKMKKLNAEADNMIDDELKKSNWHEYRKTISRVKETAMAPPKIETTKSTGMVKTTSSTTTTLKKPKAETKVASTDEPITTTATATLTASCEAREEVEAKSVVSPPEAKSSDTSKPQPSRKKSSRVVVSTKDEPEEHKTSQPFTQGPTEEERRQQQQILATAQRDIQRLLGKKGKEGVSTDSPVIDESIPKEIAAPAKEVKKVTRYGKRAKKKASVAVVRLSADAGDHDHDHDHEQVVPQVNPTVPTVNVVLTEGGGKVLKNNGDRDVFDDRDDHDDHVDDDVDIENENRALRSPHDTPPLTDTDVARPTTIADPLFSPRILLPPASILRQQQQRRASPRATRVRDDDLLVVGTPPTDYKMDFEGDSLSSSWGTCEKPADLRKFIQRHSSIPPKCRQFVHISGAPPPGGLPVLPPTPMEARLMVERFPSSTQQTLLLDHIF